MQARPLFTILSFSLLLISCSATTEELFDKGSNLLDKKKYADAIEIYSQIINRNPKLQQSYYERGICYAALKKYETALADFNKVINMQPGGPIRLTYNKNSPFLGEEEKFSIPYNDALYQRAITKYDMDSLKSSYHDFSILVAENYEKNNCLLWQGSIWLKAGKKDSGCKYFQQARLFASEKDVREADRMIMENCK